MTRIQGRDTSNWRVSSLIVPSNSSLGSEYGFLADFPEYEFSPTFGSSTLFMIVLAKLLDFKSSFRTILVFLERYQNLPKSSLHFH